VIAVTCVQAQTAAELMKTQTAPHA
jgi:hypothetical protein